MTTIGVASGDSETIRNEATGRIVGGVFGLAEIEIAQNPPPSFLSGRELFLANGRSGLSVLVERLSPGSVWLPSYLCHPVVRAVRGNGASAKFYEVDENLAITSTAWLDQVQPDDLVVFIDYFGFPSDATSVVRAKEQRAWVLRDACQALLSQTPGATDFTLFSPRKFLGVPDGGVLQMNCATELTGIALQSPPPKWWLRALRASLGRREFDLHGGGREWFELFQKSEADAPCGAFAISELSRILLRHCFDYVRVARRRRDNYVILSHALRRFAFFPDLPADVVPLGFPVRVRERDRIRQALFDHRVYPPVHWPLEGVVPAEFRASHRLAAEILTIPCDQRYDADDMERIARVVTEATRF